MKIIFKTDPDMDKNMALIFTHPNEYEIKNQIASLIEKNQKMITVINGLNNRNIQIPICSILAIESEDRMCNLRLKTGEMYLYKQRLKVAEADFSEDGFIRINNQTVVNIREVKEFASTTNARIEVTLSDGTRYFISRYYINHFRRALL